MTEIAEKYDRDNLEATLKRGEGVHIIKNMITLPNLNGFLKFFFCWRADDKLHSKMYSKQ